MVKDLEYRKLWDATITRANNIIDPKDVILEEFQADSPEQWTPLEATRFEGFKLFRKFATNAEAGWNSVQVHSAPNSSTKNLKAVNFDKTIILVKGELTIGLISEDGTYTKRKFIHDAKGVMRELHIPAGCTHFYYTKDSEAHFIVTSTIVS